MRLCNLYSLTGWLMDTHQLIRGQTSIFRMYLDGIWLHCDCTLNSTTYSSWYNLDNEPSISYLSTTRHNKREVWLKEFPASMVFMILKNWKWEVLLHRQGDIWVRIWRKNNYIYLLNNEDPKIKLFAII